MHNFEWDENKDGLINFMNKFFGLPKDKIEELIDKNFEFYSDKINLVATMKGIGHACQRGKTAFDETLSDEDKKIRIKAAKAILLNPGYSENEYPEDIYNRLKTLYNSIAAKGIDIYKTIYKTSLQKGNLGMSFDTNTGLQRVFLNDDRLFNNIYNTLIETLALPRETLAEKESTTQIANGIFEKCAATMIGDVTASNIEDVYQALLNLKIYYQPDVPYLGGEYLFGCDIDYSDLPREKQKSRAIKDGLINCPSLFACLPINIAKAFEYIVGKIPQRLIQEKLEESKLQGKTSMNEFATKCHIARTWVNNNFSILTINADEMKAKENLMKTTVAFELNYFGDGNFGRKYNFDFLFDNPASISVMNSIPRNKIYANAISNILTLQQYANTDEVIDYIKRNQYVLAMDSHNLAMLLEDVADHDKKNPSDPHMPKFFKLGKTLFGTHWKDFKIGLIKDKLANAEATTILDVESMSDWERVSKFVELFCDDDQNFVSRLQRLAEEKLRKDGLGSSKLRTDIRNLLTKHGGWDQIIKNKKGITELTFEIKSLTDRRFEVEQVKRTYDQFHDISTLQMKEEAFANDIEQSLNRIRDAFEQKRNRIEKSFSDVEKLYTLTIDFLSNKCFDDKKPISELIESELRTPLINTLKTQDGAYVDSQPTIFGEEVLVVPVSGKIFKPLAEMTTSISQDASLKLNSDRVKIVKDDKTK